MLPRLIVLDRVLSQLQAELLLMKKAMNGESEFQEISDSIEEELENIDISYIFENVNLIECDNSEWKAYCYDHLQ